MSPALVLILGACIWLGATIFVAAISMYCPDIFLHGNPIGMRCVLACTGAIVGIPVGCFGHQIYSVFKTKISADFVLNAWIGLVIPLVCTNFVLGVCCVFPLFVTLLGNNTASIWGLAHINILLWVLFILTKDPYQILKSWSPSLHETMGMVQEVLTPATRRILDVRFVIRHQIMPLAYTGFLEGTWIVPMVIIDQLRIWSHHKSSRIQHRAQRTLASLNSFHNSYDDKLVISLRNYPKRWGPVRSLLAESMRSNSRLLITSYGLRWPHTKMLFQSNIRKQSLTSPWYASLVDLSTNRFNVSGERFVFLPTWAQALQSPYQPGDWLELPIIGSGRLPYQGQSHLEDGSLVFVREGAHYLGQTVRVQVVHILHSVTGFVIFANLHTNDPTHRPH